MSITKVRTIGLGLCLTIALAASVSATTFIVSSAGGGQFTDIPPAIDAAQPGDVLLVFPGNYTAFVLSKGLTLVGYGDVPFSDAASISGVPADETAVLVNIKSNDFSIVGCMGPVLVQDMGSVQHINVQDCNDVRLRHVDVPTISGPTTNGCDVSASRLELVGCSTNGSNVPQCNPVGGNWPLGGLGVHLSNSSRVHFALSNARGGDGAYCNHFPSLGGDGGSAIQLGVGDTLFVTGGRSSTILGGAGGGEAGAGDCSLDGISGDGIRNVGGHLFYSGAAIQCQGTYIRHDCIYFPCLGVSVNGPGTAVTPDDPTLDVQGNATAGGTALFTLRAPPGATAILYFGRHAIVVPTPHVLIEQLTPKSRVVNLGTIPENGRATFTWQIAAGVPLGTLLIAQAEVTIAPGEVRRTNSIPVVLR